MPELNIDSIGLNIVFSPMLSALVLQRLFPKAAFRFSGRCLTLSTRPLVDAKGPAMKLNRQIVVSAAIKCTKPPLELIHCNIRFYCAHCAKVGTQIGRAHV